MEVQDDEINLMDLWQVIVKRRNMVILFTLLSAGLALGVSLKSPKVYEGEAVVALPRIGDAKVMVNTDETKAIINVLVREVKNGNPFDGFDKSLIKSISDIKLDQIKASDTKVRLSVQVKSEPQKAYDVFASLMKFLQGNEYVSKRVATEVSALQSNIAETKKAVDMAVKTRDEAVKLISIRNPVGFNPVDLDVKVSELKTKIIGLETSLSMIKGYEFVSGPYVYKNKIKPKVGLTTILAGISGLFISLLLVFVLEGIEKQKQR